MILTILFFIILLGVLVLVHEWGHFMVARWFGVRVDEFAFGFPPRIASVVKNGTRYALNFIPLGGYVKIYGEGGEGDGERESFSSRPVWQRSIILVAGVFMNVILAWALFSIGQAVGVPTDVSDSTHVAGARVSVIEVSPGSPADIAGLRFGDVIHVMRVGMDSMDIISIADVQTFIRSHRGQQVTLEILRGKEHRSFELLARLNPPVGEGAIGIAMSTLAIVRAPLWRAPWDGLKMLVSATIVTVRGLADTIRMLFSATERGQALNNISGPLGIFVFADHARQLGVSYFLYLSGILSMTLAIFNVLPIPALDGGRLFFLLIEKSRGVRTNQRFEQLVHTIGLVLLLILMFAITYREIFIVHVLRNL